MSLTRGQTWAYGGGDLGVALLYIAVNTHFFYFLVSVAGFSPFAAGVVFIVGRLIDAFTDPLIGSYSDAVRFSLGRNRFIRRALLPTALSFVALFALPLMPGAPVVFACIGATVFSIAYTCVLMPYLAMLPELVPDYDQRTSAIGIKSVFTMLATLLAFAVPPAVVLGFSESSDLAGSEPTAWVWMAVVLALVFTIPVFLLARIVPDVSQQERPAGTTPSPIASSDGLRSILAEVRSAWQTDGLPQATYLFLAVTVGIMITNSLLTFYLESVLLLPGDSLPGVLGALVLVSILAFPVWIWLAGRLGKRAALVLALLLEVASLLLLVSVVPSGGFSPQLWSVIALNGISIAGVTMFPWAMLPDVVELDELASGKRREGLLYALFTFAQKLATSVGVFANSIVIAAFGYVQGQAEQAAETVWALRMMMGPGAAVVFVLAALLTWYYPVTRAVHAKAREALALRKAERSEP